GLLKGLTPELAAKKLNQLFTKLTRQNATLDQNKQQWLVLLQQLLHETV
ncbi:MAG: hypothetical protein RL563_2764, partial [Pseudomonadota bacterium]